MTSADSAQPTKLNELQISLLRLFERGMSNEQTLELRRMLVNYFLQQAAEEATRIDTEHGYTAEDFERMLNQPS